MKLASLASYSTSIETCEIVINKIYKWDNNVRVHMELIRSRRKLVKLSLSLDLSIKLHSGSLV
jgi:hypothetical protein